MLSLFSGTLAANVTMCGKIEINGKKRSLYSKEVVRMQSYIVKKECNYIVIILSFIYIFVHDLLFHYYDFDFIENNNLCHFDKNNVNSSIFSLMLVKRNFFWEH